MNKEVIIGIAQEIKLRIFERTKLTCSIGIGPNKLLSKIASDINKPNGITYISNNEEEILKFMHDLTIRKIKGIGRRTEQFLQGLGIYKVCDIIKNALDLYLITDEREFAFFISASLGISSNVHIPSTEEAQKSLSFDRTFEEIREYNEFVSKIEETSHHIEERLKEKEICGNLISLKIKTSRFEVFQKQIKSNYFIHHFQDIFKYAVQLLDMIWPCDPTRLLGIRIGNIKFISEVKNSLSENQKSIKSFLSLSNKSDKSDKPDKQDIRDKQAKPENPIKINNINNFENCENFKNNPSNDLQVLHKSVTSNFPNKFIKKTKKNDQSELAKKTPITINTANTINGKSISPLNSKEGLQGRFSPSKLMQEATEKNKNKNNLNIKDMMEKMNKTAKEKNENQKSKIKQKQKEKEKEPKEQNELQELQKQKGQEELKETNEQKNVNKNEIENEKVNEKEKEMEELKEIKFVQGSELTKEKQDKQINCVKSSFKVPGIQGDFEQIVKTKNQEVNPQDLLSKAKNEKKSQAKTNVTSKIKPTAIITKTKTKTKKANKTRESDPFERPITAFFSKK